MTNQHPDQGSSAPVPPGPTVMEIIELADQIEAAELGQVDLVRIALARWGNPTPQPVLPAEGEVAELVKALAAAATLDEAMCNRIVNGQCTTLACLQRGGYVRGAGIPPNYSQAACPELDRAIALRRAAELLQQHQSPQPVPVSERLPGADDLGGFDDNCCWWGHWQGDHWLWIRDSEPVRNETHWLPAHVHSLPAHALAAPGDNQ
jgi:hypothetical protein